MMYLCKSEVARVLESSDNYKKGTYMKCLEGCYTIKFSRLGLMDYARKAYGR